MNKKNKFQTRLRMMLQFPDMLVFGDKISNIYKMNNQNSQKLPKENISMTYKKAPMKLDNAISS